MEGYIKAFKAISLITVFSICNFFLTVLLQVILAAAFGAKIEMDAYLLAAAIPIVVISLLTNASEVVFVPFLKERELTGSKASLEKTESIIFNLLFLGLSGFVIIAILSASNTVRFLSSGFTQEARSLAVILFRIVMPAVIFGGLSGFLISIYYSREKFGPPAIAKIINNLIVIAVFFVLYPLLKIKALAVGVLAGNIVQFLFLLPIFIKAGRPLLNLEFRVLELHKVGYRFLQMLIGGGAVALIIPFERFFASGLPEGSISYLGYASKIISILLLLPVTAIPIVLLPNLSRHFTTQNLDKLRENLSLGIRFVFFIIFPVAVLLFVFRTQIVFILLERGNFDKLATNGVSGALVCYIGVLLGAGLAGIAGKGFYAIQNTFIPSVIMVASFIFYILIAGPLSRVFSYMGLALAMSLAILSGLIVDLFILRHMLRGLKGKKIFVTVYKVLLASFVMGALSWILYQRLSLGIIVSKMELLLKISISALAGIAVFVLFCFLLKLKELEIIRSAMFVKASRK